MIRLCSTYLYIIYTKKNMELINNHGYVKRTPKGFFGELSIEGFKMDIQATFWNKTITGCDLWLQRRKKKIFEEKTNTFKSYIPKPYFECYALKDKGKNKIYRGEFIFVGFKYSLSSFWEDKTEKLLNISIERTKDQPILDRLKEIKFTH